MHARAGQAVALALALTAVQLTVTLTNALFWFWSLQIATKIRVSMTLIVNAWICTDSWNIHVSAWQLQHLYDRSYWAGAHAAAAPALCAAEKTKEYHLSAKRMHLRQVQALSAASAFVFSSSIRLRSCSGAAPGRPAHAAVPEVPALVGRRQECQRCWGSGESVCQ